ncbi:primase C-terminal domain-containing protein [Avibacterium paragallinarum]|uniref:primase C-terminal domain-containing protein n=1 Tax=Avibacterium paragallinarum TaxID=728 RepID=UPI00021ACFDD|nr:HTH domain-containing protein [Avibacterium paragallinarum]
MFNVPAYSLDYLADFVNLSDNPIFHYNDDVAEGRNCDLFNQIKRIGYREVLQFKQSDKKLYQFNQYLLSLLESLNQNQHPPLPYRELKGIAKSAARWIWERFSQSQFSQIQSSRSKKRWKNQQEKKKLLIETFDKNKPNLSLKQIAQQFGVSLSTIHRWAKEFEWGSETDSGLKYQQITSLRNQGLKWREIAERLSITEGNAKMCFKRHKP